jgi:type III secretion protein C
MKKLLNIIQFRQFVIAGVVFAIYSIFSAAHAFEQLKKTEVSLNAEGKPIRDFLRDFAVTQGIDIFVDPSIDGAVSGKFKLKPEVLLNTLAVSHRFKWYFEGDILQVVPDAEMTSEIISIQDTNWPKLKAALSRMSLIDPKFPLVVSPTDGTMRVSGPKRYVDQIKQAIKSITQVPEGSGFTASNRADIRVFPLNHVWAADTRTGTGSSQVIVPGVATVLKRLFASESQPSIGAEANNQLRTISPNRTVPIRGSTEVVQVPPDRNPSAPPSLFSGQNIARPRYPQIEADVRQNAVLIRDLPERLALYGPVIAKLDQPTGLVEIDVQIVEISSDFVEQLGIDWRGRSSRVQGQFGTTPTIDQPDVVSSVIGGSFTTLAGGAVRNLILRVNALVDTGHAKVQASPKILTMANVEAIVENKSEFYVRVASNLDANLFTVSSGTSLRVTPMLSWMGKDKAVSMAITIEDGNLTDRTVDNIPVVTRNTINTQASVKEGESLLIAGYSKELIQDNELGVPGLSSIPFLGRAFKSNSKKTQKVERFVLITPKTFGHSAERSRAATFSFQ